jgi:hypothetical protein
MEQKQLDEASKIALFMGYEYFPDETLSGVKGVFKKEGIPYKLAHYFNYHVSYEALMEVVDKIEATVAGPYLGFSVKIENNHCAISCYAPNQQPGILYQTPYGSNPETKKQAILDGIIAFIDWYNKNK